MLILSQTTDTIQVSLASTVTTRELECFASWRDITATPSYVAGRTSTLTEGTFDVEIVESPIFATQRVIDHISIYNSDTASATVTVKFDADGTQYTLWKGTLATGERLGYEDGDSWHKINADGDRITVGETGTAGTNGSDGALTVSEAEIDFGTRPVCCKTFTVTDAGVSAASKIIAVQSGKAATGRDADENEMDAIVFSCVPGSGTFTLYARSFNPVTGLYKINYQFS